MHSNTLLVSLLAVSISAAADTRPAPDAESSNLPSGVTNEQHQNILIEGVDFSGGTIFSLNYLQQQVKPFIGRALEASDIEEIRYRITKLYVDKGYINSGAQLDGYNPKTKHLRLKLIEGGVSDIKVQIHKPGADSQPGDNADTRSSGLTESYVAKRLRLSSGPPLKMQDMQDRVLVLLSNPMIASVNGALLPGPKPSESILQAEATGLPYYNLSLITDNYTPASIGDMRTTVAGTLRNLTGWGDLTNLSLSDSGGGQGGHFDFSAPLNSHDTTVHFAYDRNNMGVEEDSMRFLGIKNKYVGYELRFDHPLVLTTRREFHLGLGMVRKSNRTYMLGMPFSFSPGSKDGKATISPALFTQTYIQHEVNYGYELRSTLSRGTNAWGATNLGSSKVHNTRFWSWLFQNNYSYYLKNWSLVGRFDGQLASCSLPTMEQTALGGSSTVRGYRESTILRDQFMMGSLELRYELMDANKKARYGSLQLATFGDYAVGWEKGDIGNHDVLDSLGVGILWTGNKYMQAQLYWGRKLRNPPQSTTGSLQDNGVHLMVQFRY